MSKCLIITGMHRSHTSYVTQCLQLAGLHLGDNLIAGDEFNERGHFENQEVVTFHEEILESRGLRNKWKGINQKALESFHYSSQEVDQAHKIMERLQKSNKDYGWKDPRGALFLPFWHTQFPSNYYLFIVRNPMDCVNSLIRRSKRNSDFKSFPILAYSLYNYWDITNRRILQFVKSNPKRSKLIYAMGDLLDEDATKSINETIREKWRFQLTEIDFKGPYDASLIKSANPPAYLYHVLQSRRSTKNLWRELLQLRDSDLV